MDNLSKVIKSVNADVPATPEKIKEAIKKAHAKMKPKTTKYSKFDVDVKTYTDATFVREINTRSFRSTSFRQGVAVAYEELKKPDPVAGEEKKNEEDQADIRPALVKHFKQFLKQDLVRTFKIIGCRLDDCKWELDYPKFLTALDRAFGSHMSCYG